ncbi:MAG: SPOR domain-containing protein [bacterium]
MKNDKVHLNSGLMIKALIMSFFLLATAFIAGLLIAKSGFGEIEKTTDGDKNGVQEKLSDCSYKLQEITAKYISLTETAKEKGLMDDSARLVPNVICAPPKEEPKQEKQEAPDPEKDKENSQLLVKTETGKSKKCPYSIQIFADASKERALSLIKRHNLENAWLIEEVTNEKNLHKVRMGCYSSEAEAERELPVAKEIASDAYIVKE